MDKISSAEFRKTYPRLEVQTQVTVNGHVIGTWTPMIYVGLTSPPGTQNLATITKHFDKDAPGMDTRNRTQAERDAILRRINRGG